MKFEYVWTDDNNFRLFWDGSEITEEPVELPRKQYTNGVPRGAKQFAAEWVAAQSVPDENKLQDSINQLAAIQAGKFEERNDE